MLTWSSGRHDDPTRSAFISERFNQRRRKDGGATKNQTGPLHVIRQGAPRLKIRRRKFTNWKPANGRLNAVIARHQRTKRGFLLTDQDQNTRNSAPLKRENGSLKQSQPANAGQGTNGSMRTGCLIHTARGQQDGRIDGTYLRLIEDSSHRLHSAWISRD